MKKWQTSATVMASFLLVACGGGGEDSKSLGGPLTLSGMVIWQAPVPNAEIEVRCNQTPEVQKTRSDENGRYTITIVPTREIPLSGAATECVARASWNQPLSDGDVFVRKTESYAVNYEKKDSLRMNFNAAAGAWTQAMARPYFDVKRLMDRNLFETLRMNEFTFNQSATRIIGKNPYLADMPGLLPPGFEQRPYAMRPQSYAFEMGDAHAQAVMQLARDLDASGITQYGIGLGGGGSDAAPHFAHFAKGASFTRSVDGKVLVSLAAGSSFLREIYGYEDGQLLQTPVKDFEYMPIRVALVTSEGIVQSLSEVMVRKFGGTSFELGPEVLDAIPAGTVLRIYVYQHVFGFAELRL